MADEQRPIQRRKSPFGILFSFLLVFGVVILFFSMLRGPGSKKISRVEFVSALQEKRLVTLVETPKEEVLVKVTGKYYKTSSAKRTTNFVIRFGWDEYYRYERGWEYTENEVPIDDEHPPKIVDAKLCDLVRSKAADGEFEFIDVTDIYTTDWWSQWGPTIITIGLELFVLFFLFSRLAGSIGASNNQALSFNKSRARRVTNSKVRFDDVAGANEEKSEMKELVDYLKDPGKFSKFGAKLPKGVLLVGPPGCGKTLLAKAVAGEAGVPFFSISGSDFVEMFVGVGAGRVRDMFKNAKENAPCLVFIDEIDAVGRQRGAGLGGGNDEREQTLNQLLVEMDGFSDNAGIIVIAATNRDDVLDPALLRAGRFDRKITVSLPDRDGRESIFKVHARNKTVDPSVNYNALAKRTVGFSGADIENIMNEAAILAVRRNKTEISIAEIDEAIDRRVAGPAKSSRSLNAHEREIVAYHEAGHAIIGLRYPHSDKVQKITIIPRGNTGGHVRMTPEEDRFLLTKKELEARIIGYLGGRSSEETFFNDVSTGAQNDIEMATHIARMMVCELGMSELGPIQYERDMGSVFLGRDYTNSQKNFSVETASKIDSEIRKIIDESHKTARKVIADNKDDVILIAKTLLEHEQITAEQIDYLLEHRHLKEGETKKAPVQE